MVRRPEVEDEHAGVHIERQRGSDQGTRLGDHGRGDGARAQQRGQEAHSRATERVGPCGSILQEVERALKAWRFALGQWQALGRGEDVARVRKAMAPFE